MSFLAIIVLTITMIGSCISVREIQPDAAIHFSHGRVTSYGADIRAAWTLLFEPSCLIWTICLVKFFAWLGWFPFLYYTVTYGFRFCASNGSQIQTITSH